MLKIGLRSTLILLVLSLPSLAASARKDNYVPVRKGKKGKLETSATTKLTPSKKLTGLHPQAQVKMNAALQEMKTIGVCPTVTSGYRSSAQQHDMYRCSHRHRCRVRRGIYGARKPGTSLHEAGLAVDFANVAAGQKRRRHLTRDGRKIVKVMQKHGFQWRYGLQDPAHFELEPRVAGFKSARAAIAAAQRRAAQQRWVANKTARTQPKSKARRRA
jgi:LAS superfamily LD-carboxypeptidase LdcB